MLAPISERIGIPAKIQMLKKLESSQTKMTSG
jgi:hypothetical protein